MSVEMYTTQFEQLMLKCDLTEPEEHTIARYLGGLKPSLANIIQLQPYWTLRDVQSLAYKVEKQQLNHKSPTIRVGTTSESLSGTLPPAAVTQPVKAEVGEVKRFEKGSSSTPPPTTARKCYKCHGYGHIASACPTRALITFTEQGEVVEFDEPPPPSERDQIEEIHLHPDEGELLMVRRSLQLEPTREQSQQ